MSISDTHGWHRAVEDMIDGARIGSTSLSEVDRVEGSGVGVSVFDGVVMSRVGGGHRREREETQPEQQEQQPSFVASVGHGFTSATWGRGRGLSRGRRW